MSNTISARDQKLIWHPFTQAKIAPPPIAISHALGSYLYTDGQKKLFDGISSWWTNSHGHCNPSINDAINKQLEKLEHVIFANFTHEPAVKLAELLVSVLPSGLSRVFFSDNGATSVEVALKMAFQYWQHRQEDRPYFIALEHGYHGDTFGAMSVSERSAFTKPFWPLLFSILTCKSTCVSEMTQDRSEKEITKNALNHLADLLEKNKGKVAGIIIEPMLQVAGGLKIFTKGFLSGIKDLSIKYDVLLIADEVATGFYRTGKYFACEHEDVTPDIMCLAKGLTGGYLPLAVTVATEKIYEAFLSDQKAHALLHGHSFTGNPLGCAAAVASLEIFQASDTKVRIKNICEAINNGIAQFHELPTVKHARALGTVAVIEMESKERGYLSQDALKIAEYCFERGLYIRPLGNIIYLMPPLCSTTEEITWALNLIKSALL